MLDFIGCVTVSVLASSGVYCWFKLWSGQTIEYEISISCFFTKHATLRNKSKDWLAQNQDHISDLEWRDMSTLEL
jgi:hypothetical protein